MINYTEIIKEICHYLTILSGVIGSILVLVYGVKKMINTPLKSYFDEKFESQKELFMSFIQDLKTIAKENCNKIDQIEDIISRHDITLQNHTNRLYSLEKKIAEHGNCLQTITFDIKSIRKELNKNKNGKSEV